MSDFNQFNVDLEKAQRQANNSVYYGNSVLGTIVIQPSCLPQLSGFLYRFKKWKDGYHRAWFDDVHVRLRVTSVIEWVTDVTYDDTLDCVVNGYYRKKQGVRIKYWITYGENIPSFEFGGAVPKTGRILTLIKKFFGGRDTQP